MEERTVNILFGIAIVAFIVSLGFGWMGEFEVPERCDCGCDDDCYMETFVSELSSSTSIATCALWDDGQSCCVVEIETK